MSTELTTVEQPQIEQAPSMDASIITGLPHMTITKNDTAGIKAYTEGETLSWKGDETLDLNQLLTFIWKPVIQYDVYIDNDGNPVTKNSSSQEQYPYVSFFLNKYQKQNNIDIHSVPKDQITEVDGIDLSLVQSHLMMDPKQSNVKVKIVYLGTALYKGQLYGAHIQQGKWAMWGFNKDIEPKKTFERLTKLHDSLKGDARINFDFFNAGKPSVSGGSTLTPVMWGDCVQLLDSKADKDRNNRGLHLVPVKDGKEGIPFVDLSLLMEGVEDKLAAFEATKSKIVSMMESPVFQQEILNRYKNMLPFFVNKRHQVADIGKVLETDVQTEKTKQKEMTKEEQDLFTDESL